MKVFVELIAPFEQVKQEDAHAADELALFGPAHALDFLGNVLDAGLSQPTDGETVHKRFLRPGLSGEQVMKLHYHPDTDSLYIELKAAAGPETPWAPT